MNDFIVFKRYVADRLLTMGFTLLRIKPHKKDSRDSVFIFKNEDGIIEAISVISEEQRNGIHE